MLGGPLGGAIHILAYGAAAVYCFVLPGYAISLAVAPPNTLSWLGQIAVASALSISLYAVLTLWTYALGIGLWTAIVWGPGAIGLVYILWRHRNLIQTNPFAGRNRRECAITVALLTLVGGLTLSRFLPVRGMVAPAWGDSVHHTMIVQLVQDHGGLFQSWAPYAPIETFSYHFGFHVAMAVWAIATGQAVVQSVITGGQLLNVLAALALYPLTVRLTGNRVAGFGAVLVAGFISQQPGMFVNWGRYTQLAAQIILPIWVWALDIWWTEPKRPSRRMMAIVVLLATGMALTHYRVAIVGLCAAAAWGLWSLWLLRKQWQEWLVRTIWLAGAGMVTLALVAPWILTVRSSRMSYVAGALAGRSTDLPNVRVELAAWRSINTDYAPWLWASSLIAAVAALWRGRRLVIPLLLWVTLTFLAANPFLIGFAGTGIVTNQLLVLALYIPMSLLVGWLLSVLWQWLGDFRLRGYPAGRAAFVGLVLLATAFGFRRQTTIVDPFYQMVTENDVAALKWIDSNVPDDSHFLANAFPAYNDSLVVGSDAGWWLPYFTRRASNVPPILYSVEALSPEVDRQAYLEVVHDVRASEGEPAALRAAMCQYGLNYVFLGDRQGSVGYGDTQLVKPEWLVENMDFQLLHESGNAQVWSFDTDVCGRLEE